MLHCCAVSPRAILPSAWYPNTVIIFSEREECWARGQKLFAQHHGTPSCPHSLTYGVPCGRMAEWTYARFPQLDRSAPAVGRAGVYSETPDLLPIFGPPRPGSRLCYLVGCNAWGQVRTDLRPPVTLSRCSLVPVATKITSLLVQFPLALLDLHRRLLPTAVPSLWYLGGVLTQVAAGDHVVPRRHGARRDRASTVHSGGADDCRPLQHPTLCSQLRWAQC